MTDALLTQPRASGQIVPPDLYELPPSPQEAMPDSGPAQILFAERRQQKVADDLQGVIIKGGILSLLTLTIYRFWMKTDQRRLIWRETRLDGDGFEYTGTPLELLVGSMIAIVILAVWFGIANLGLTYVQLAAWQNFDVSIFLFPIVISPLVAFAIYRARRYRLLRTKWRGIRFGMDGSALKYAGHWVLWTIAQVLTLGFLTPHKRLALERIMTTHMLYGDARFEFEPPKGALGHLTAHWMLPWITGLAVAALLVLGIYSSGDLLTTLETLDQQAEDAGTDKTALRLNFFLGIALIPLVLSYPFYLRYKSREIATVLSSRRLLNAWCESRLTWGATFRPAAAYVGYWLLLIVPVFIALGLMILVAIGIALTIDGKDFSIFTGDFQPQIFESLGAKVTIYTGMYFFYGGLILFSLWLAALIHFRRLHTYICRGTVVHNLASLHQVKQRVRDEQLESEGFADALDVGGI